MITETERMIVAVQQRIDMVLGAWSPVVLVEDGAAEEEVQDADNND